MESLSDGLRLERNPTADLLEKVFQLRVIAWRARQPRFSTTVDIWSDAHDRDARHFLVVRDSLPVAAARLTLHVDAVAGPDGELYRDIIVQLAPPIGILSRLVVHPDFAGRGLATFLDKVRIAEARQLNCQTMLASTSAGPFRRRQLEALEFSRIAVADYKGVGVLADVPAPEIFALSL